MTAALVALALAAADPALATAPAAEAHPLGFQARASKANVRLGEPFDYVVEIRHAPAERYQLHGAPALAPFHLDGAPRCRDEPEKGEAVTTCTMRLALFTLGAADVPDLPFDVDGPGGKAVLQVPGPRVTGVGVVDPSAPPAALALRDIAPPAPLLVRSLRLLFWALGVLAAAALVAAGVSWLRRRRPARAAPPPVPPHERLARRLAALEAERLPARGMGREHVERLAEMVREYLGALPAPRTLDRTTAETVAALRGAPDPRVDLDALQAFLGEADLVKFARWPADAETCSAGLEYARGLLERTRPPPPAAPGGLRATAPLADDPRGGSTP